MAELLSKSDTTDHIVLACEVPEGSEPGSIFHVQLNDRYFEVITPEDALPGQTINIVVPSQSSVSSEVAGEKFASGRVADNESTENVVSNVVQPNKGLLESLKSIGDKALAQAKSLDEKYKICDKVVEVATPAIEKMKSVDEKYQISERAIAAGEKAKARITEIDEKYMISAKTSAIIAAGAEKIRSLDETHKLSEKVAGVGEVIATYAREIDSRFAVSATVGRIVESGAKLVIAALDRALEMNERHRIMERTGEALASGTEAVVGTVQRFTSSSTPSATAEVEVLEPVTTSEKAIATN